MTELVCFFHPKYDGQGPPDLTCRHCCSKYVDAVAARQKKLREQNARQRAYNWVTGEKHTKHAP